MSLNKVEVIDLQDMSQDISLIKSPILSKIHCKLYNKINLILTKTLTPLNTKRSVQNKHIEYKKAFFFDDVALLKMMVS